MLCTQVFVVLLLVLVSIEASSFGTWPHLASGFKIVQANKARTSDATSTPVPLPMTTLPSSMAPIIIVEQVMVTKEPPKEPMVSTDPPQDPIPPLHIKVQGDGELSERAPQAPAVPITFVVPAPIPAQSPPAPALPPASPIGIIAAALPTISIPSPAEQGTFKPGAALAPEPLTVTAAPPPPPPTPATSPAPTPAPLPPSTTQQPRPPPSEEEEEDEDDDDDDSEADASVSEADSPEVPPRPIASQGRPQAGGLVSKVSAPQQINTQGLVVQETPVIQSAASAVVPAAEVKPVAPLSQQTPANPGPAAPSAGVSKPSQQQKPSYPPFEEDQDDENNSSAEDDDDDDDDDESGSSEEDEEDEEAAGRLDLRQGPEGFLEDEPLYVSRKEDVAGGKYRLVFGAPIVVLVDKNSGDRPKLRIVDDYVRPGDKKVGEVLEREGDQIVGVVTHDNKEELIAFAGPAGVIPLEQPEIQSSKNDQVQHAAASQGSGSDEQRKSSFTSSSEESHAYVESYESPQLRTEAFAGIDVMGGLNPLQFIYRILGRGENSTSSSKKPPKKPAKYPVKKPHKRPVDDVPYFVDSDYLQVPHDEPPAFFYHRRPSTPLGYPSVPFPSERYYPHLRRSHLHYRNPYEKPFSFPIRRNSHILSEDPTPPYYDFNDGPVHPSDYSTYSTGHFLGVGPGTSFRTRPRKGPASRLDITGNDSDLTRKRRPIKKPLNKKNNNTIPKCPVSLVQWKNTGDYHCPLTLGPCLKGQWLVLNRNGKSFRCKPMKCEKGRMFYEGGCYSGKDSEMLCPGAEMRLYLNLYGEAYCDCKPNHYYWSLDGHCYPAYSQGPCQVGYHLRVDTLRKRYPSCVRNPCFYDNLVYVAGTCHELGNPKVCDGRNKVLQVSPVTGVAECISHNTIFLDKKSDKPCQLGSLQRLRGCPTLYPSSKEKIKPIPIKEIVPALSTLLKAATQGTQLLDET